MFGSSTASQPGQTGKGKTCEATREGRACHGLRVMRWKYKKTDVPASPNVNPPLPTDVIVEVCLSCHMDMLYIQNFQKSQHSAGITMSGVDLTTASWEEIK